MNKIKLRHSYDNISYILYTYTYYWLKNALTMTYKNCFSHAISHLVLGVRNDVPYKSLF